MVAPERALVTGEFLYMMSIQWYRLFLYQHSFALNFRLEFWVHEGCEVRTPNVEEDRGRIGGREWYHSKERW